MHSAYHDRRVLSHLKAKTEEGFKLSKIINTHQ
jgi:hypothetical protein